ncbi:amidase [Algiphilus sp.]|uniref:amidase n=1 Tax=Algiphilus sp. TaxID=1872431 RepID=UPI003BAC5658
MAQPSDPSSGAAAATDSPWLRSSATEMAEALRQGRVTARRLVDLHIARIEAVNPRLNAVVVARFDAARAEADAADARRAAADPDTVLPPLLGVPCTLKENFAFAGLPQTSGLVQRARRIAEQDAPTVGRLRAAGAIPLCTTNVPELCMWMETHNRLYGRTNNPYDPRRIVGGSSGGEGAIVGAGGAPFGLGADVGGSIRFPAFFNGVFGHKPTPGIVPNSGQMPEPQGAMNRNCVTGPISRRAGDLWPLMRILAGADGRDPECHGRLTGDPATVDLSALPVVSIVDDGRHRVQRDLRHAQAGAAQWLGEQGGGLRHIRPASLRHAFEIWSTLMQEAGPEAFAAQLGEGTPIAVGRELLKWSLRRSPHTLPALALAGAEKLPMPRRRFLRMAESLRQELLDAIGDGVLLYPPYSSPAPRHNVPMLRVFHFAYCGLFNVLGFPSTAVPLGLNARGLPLGTQVIAAPGRDHVCVAVAEALEQGFGGWVPPWTVRNGRAL